MSNIRPVQAMLASDILPAAPRTGIPIFEMVKPTALYIDATYQRAIGERGRRQIRKIVKEFCWTRFKPPICAYGEYEGERVLMVLDGQHTAIAAASNPHVEQIPVMIVEAPETSAQAAAFVGQNSERLAVTPLQLHRAAVAAGDEDALTVMQVCERAGVRILYAPPSQSRYQAGDTVAVAAVDGLVRRHTAPRARQILEVLSKANLAPITAHHVRAAEYLMTDKDFRNRFEPGDLSEAIGEAFLTAEDDAKHQSYAHRIPYWKALAGEWFRRTKKRRMHLRIAA